jgi:hypothetical protein
MVVGVWVSEDEIWAESVFLVVFSNTENGNSGSRRYTRPWRADYRVQRLSERVPILGHEENIE